MEELPVNRPSNPSRNQGYIMRLAGQTGAGFHAGSSRKRHRVRRRKQTGGKISLYPRTKRRKATCRNRNTNAERWKITRRNRNTDTERSRNRGKNALENEKKGSNFTKQKGGIVSMAMLGPALMMAGPGKKVVKNAGKKSLKNLKKRNIRL